MFSVDPLSAAPFSAQGQATVENVSVTLTGVSATMAVGSVDIVISDWTEIGITQAPGYTTIVPTQSPGWAEGSIY